MGQRQSHLIPASIVIQPIDFGISVGQVIKGWDNTVPGHNVGSRLVVSIPPQYGYGSRGVPQAGIGGDDTLVFVIDIIATTSGR